MTAHLRSTLARGALLAGSIAAAAVLAAACSSSSKSGGSSSTSAGPAGSSSAMNAPAAQAGVKIETHSGPLGTYLTDSSGKTLYIFASDGSKMSTCDNQCASVWPPLTTKGTPSGSGGVTSSMLATITRSDGSKQVTYAGHPLYYYTSDTKAGETTGQGINNFGAKWWVLAPSGQPITSGGAGSSAPASSSGGGGGWA